jgi:integrase
MPSRQGSIRKRDRASGIRWEARYRDNGNDMHARTFLLKADALAWLNDMVTRTNRNEWTETTKTRRRTLTEWVDQWWPAHSPSLRPSTAARDRAYLDCYLLPHLGKLPLAKIDNPTVQAWVGDLSRRGLAPATVQKAYQILSKAMRAAVAARELPYSPCRDVSLPQIANDEARFLSSVELLDVEDAMPEAWRDLVPFLGDVGLRIGELAALRWRDVDLERLTVTVRDTLTENPTVNIGPPKTLAGRRTVPTLTQETADRLLLRRGKAEADAYVFAAPLGGPLLPNAWRRRVWRPAVAASGLAAPLPTPHALRHTAVAHWIQAGVVDAFKLQRWAGHRSVTTIYRVYGHLLSTDAASERDALTALRAAARVKVAERQELLSHDASA